MKPRIAGREPVDAIRGFGGFGEFDELSDQRIDRSNDLLVDQTIAQNDSSTRINESAAQRLSSSVLGKSANRQIGKSANRQIGKCDEPLIRQVQRIRPNRTATARPHEIERPEQTGQLHRTKEREEKAPVRDRLAHAEAHTATHAGRPCRAPRIAARQARGPRSTSAQQFGVS
ncbi:hypothetical protein QZM22_25885 [Burkholderia oklahomensis]|uniref:hypothetical protein n=1 Tax=Burkholderia oklahomensis TaxID=342113 RepID=UPI0026526E20|nr:hypothetical protein [Burkholderia oklahomensis]MDN7675834.1 hypothetical protein [Burkholderia oklahomensis]